MVSPINVYSPKERLKTTQRKDGKRFWWMFIESGKQDHLGENYNANQVNRPSTLTDSRLWHNHPRQQIGPRSHRIGSRYRELVAIQPFKPRLPLVVTLMVVQVSNRTPILGNRETFIIRGMLGMIAR